MVIIYLCREANFFEKRLLCGKRGGGGADAFLQTCCCFIIFSLFFFLQNVDLTKHRLIYDGALTLKLSNDRGRVKTIDLHVLLLEDCIMLLQKQDDKYLLKFITAPQANVTAPGGQAGKHSPVIKFSTMHVRPNASGKSVLFFCASFLH